METLYGIVSRIRYADPETGRILADVQYETPEGIAHAVFGSYSRGVEVGDCFATDGSWRSTTFKGTGNLKGRSDQMFEGRHLRPSFPRTVGGVIRYLSWMFVGVDTQSMNFGITGEAVRSLVHKEGVGVLGRALADPEILIGLSSRQSARQAILAEWRRRTRAIQAVVLMESCGLEKKVIDRIIGIWREDALDRLKQNPYEVAKIPSVAFADAERLGKKFGVTSSDPRRLSAAVDMVLKQGQGSGHMCANVSTLISGLSDVSGVDHSTLGTYLIKAANDSVLTGGNFSIFADSEGIIVALQDLLEAEKTISSRLCSLVRTGRRNPVPAVRKAADELFASSPEFARLDPTQRLAVIMAASEPVSIVTGGPGVGKSTVMKAVARIVETSEKSPLFLVGPTGKSAKALQEATGRKTSTIHRCLKARGRKGAFGKSTFLLGADNPLPPGSVVIADELSMVDAETMSALVQAIPADGRLIIVGDPEQLLSVGPGAVLSDLLESNMGGRGVIPSVALKKVYRTSKNGAVAFGAVDIRHGRVPAMTDVNSGRLPEVASDQSGGAFIHHASGKGIADQIERLVCDTFPRRGFDPMRDVAILVPQGPGQAGAWEINRRLQARLNPNGASIGGVTAGIDDPPDMPIPRVGDRVLLTVNDADNDVMNGDIGTITSCRKGENNRWLFKVAFDCGAVVEYPAPRWREFLLAYCLTVHRSQGSQYKVVVLPMTTAHDHMLSRRLFYTGWTRARSEAHVVGEMEAVRRAVTRGDLDKRETLLKRLCSHWTPFSFGSTPDWGIMARDIGRSETSDQRFDDIQSGEDPDTGKGEPSPLSAVSPRSPVGVRVPLMRAFGRATRRLPESAALSPPDGTAPIAISTEVARSRALRKAFRRREPTESTPTGPAGP